MKILGIDIGGSGIKGAPVDTKKGQLLAERYRLSTPDPATPETVASTVKELVDFFGWEGTIGCGFPAAVKNETVMTAANIDPAWIGINAAEEIKRITGCTTHVINDVDAAGIAEMKFGAGKKNKGTVFVIAVGTGIGSSLFTKGRLIPNTELGHLRIDGSRTGEQIASNVVRKEECLDWEQWAERFNLYLKRLEELFWPDLFIIGGGISKYYREFEPYLDKSFPIKMAKLLNNAGIVGAACSARKVARKSRSLIS